MVPRCVPLHAPPSPAHLAGVPGAALGDVALVHSLPAGHATRLVLHPGDEATTSGARGTGTWRLTGSGHVGRWIQPPPPAPHLAAFAAEPVAAHGIVGQRALLAAVSPALRTLLLGQRPARHGMARHVSHPAMLATPARPWRADPGPHSPPASRSRTPLPPPRSRCRTPEGPRAAGTEVGGSESYWGRPQARCCHKAPEKGITSPGE